MIKASELRVGNIINMPFIGGDVVVVGIPITTEGEQFIQCKANEGTYFERPDIYDPIKLTPEWLERFGFDNTNCIYLGLDDGSKYLQVIRTTYDCLILGADNTISASLKPIKYVHQLQNLYFALTGQELELKAIEQKEKI